MTPISIVLKRPLVDVYCACAALGVSEDGVLALIDSGSIRWSFNIGCRGSRRCLRIFAPALADHQAGRKPEENFDKVLAVILPGHAPMVTGVSVARALLCAPHHVAKLLADRELEGKPARGMGPNSSAQISRASIVKFLKGRVV